MRVTNASTDEAVMGELGSRLARARLDRNMTQEQLAQEAGLARQTVVRIESGDAVRTPALIRVLRALQLLEGLDSAVPEPVPSPIEQLEREGRRRRRARPRPAADEPGPGSGWEWGTR